MSFFTDEPLVDHDTVTDSEEGDSYPNLAALEFPSGDSFAIWDVFKALGNFLQHDFHADADLPDERRFRHGMRALDDARKTPETYESFLRSIHARLSLSFIDSANGTRVLHWLNKTPCLNLNGIRLTSAEWLNKISPPSAFVLQATYEDKFGSLGVVSAMQGNRAGPRLQVESWAISNRARHRRIEHQLVKQLFERFSADVIRFEFAPTGTNQDAAEFFATLIGRTPESALDLTREQFEKRRPPLHHTVEEVLRPLSESTSLSLPAE